MIHQKRSISCLFDAHEIYLHRKQGHRSGLFLKNL